MAPSLAAASYEKELGIFVISSGRRSLFWIPARLSDASTTLVVSMATVGRLDQTSANADKMMLRVYESPPGQAETTVHTFTLISTTSAETEFDVINELLINARTKFSVEEAVAYGGSDCDSEMSSIIAHMKLSSNNPYISEKPTKLIVLRLPPQRQTQSDHRPTLPQDASSQTSRTASSPPNTNGADIVKVPQSDHINSSATTPTMLTIRTRTNPHPSVTEQPHLTPTIFQALLLPPSISTPVFTAGEVRTLIPPSGITPKGLMIVAGIEGQLEELKYLMPLIRAVAKIHCGTLYPKQIPDAPNRSQPTMLLLAPPQTVPQAQQPTAYEKLCISELKVECWKRGLSVIKCGLKQQFIHVLEQHDANVQLGSSGLGHETSLLPDESKSFAKTWDDKVDLGREKSTHDRQDRKRERRGAKRKWKEVDSYCSRQKGVQMRIVDVSESLTPASTAEAEPAILGDEPDFLLTIDDFTWDLHHTGFAEQSSFFEGVFNGTSRKGSGCHISLNNDSPVTIAKMLWWVHNDAVDLSENHIVARAHGPNGPFKRFFNQLSFDEILVAGLNMPYDEGYDIVEHMLRDHPKPPLATSKQLEYHQWKVEGLLDQFRVAHKYGIPKLVNATADEMFLGAQYFPFTLWAIAHFLESTNIERKLLTDRIVMRLTEQFNVHACDARFGAFMANHPELVNRVFDNQPLAPLWCRVFAVLPKQEDVKVAEGEDNEGEADVDDLSGGEKTDVPETDDDGSSGEDDDASFEEERERGSEQDDSLPHEDDGHADEKAKGYGSNHNDFSLSDVGDVTAEGKNKHAIGKDTYPPGKRTCPPFGHQDAQPVAGVNKIKAPKAKSRRFLTVGEGEADVDALSGNDEEDHREDADESEIQGKVNALCPDKLHESAQEGAETGVSYIPTFFSLTAQLEAVNELTTAMDELEVGTTEIPKANADVQSQESDTNGSSYHTADTTLAGPVEAVDEPTARARTSTACIKSDLKSFVELDAEEKEFDLTIGDFTWRLKQNDFVGKSRFFWAALTREFKEAEKGQVILHDDSARTVARMICWFNSGNYIVFSGRPLHRNLAEDEVTFDEMLKIGFTGQQADQVVNAMMADQPYGLLSDTHEQRYRWALYEILDLFMVADKYGIPELVDETLERVFRIVRHLEHDFVWELVEFIESNHFSKELMMKKIATFFAEHHGHFWSDARYKAWLSKDFNKGMAERIVEELGRLDLTKRGYHWDDWSVDYM